jgi:beta-glucanase (GH16 family)
MSEYQDSANGGAYTGTGMSTRTGWTSGMAFVRARADAGVGVTMCIGMIGLDNWPPELDFYEDGKGTGNTRQLFQATAIYGAAENMEWNVDSAVDATQWHVYGVEWNATTISFLVDGVVWYSIANPDSSSSDPNSLVQPMKLFMSIETLDWGVNNVPVDSSTPAVVNMNVDWAVVYTPS